MATAKKTIIVVQTGSVTAQKKGMKETLIGLGLGRPRSRRELEDTSSVRGMITKVRHLVRVEEQGEAKAAAAQKAPQAKVKKEK
ncbi:MAG: 50S ribosomal protein L30 [Pseudomonadota bacterium]|nr:50S ribosomal protein L30 [Pseudomonadota bacterium]